MEDIVNPLPSETECYLAFGCDAKKYLLKLK